METSLKERPVNIRPDMRMHWDVRTDPRPELRPADGLDPRRQLHGGFEELRNHLNSACFAIAISAHSSAHIQITTPSTSQPTLR